MSEKKLTQEELLPWVDCGYLANNPMFNRRFNEMVRTQLKEIVVEYFKYDYLRNDPECRSVDEILEEKAKQQKPTVTREEISSAVHEGRNWDDGTFHEGDAQKAVVELLKSKGVEVVE